jgi:hypothetical protein
MSTLRFDGGLIAFANTTFILKVDFELCFQGFTFIWIFSSPLILYVVLLHVDLLQADFCLFLVDLTVFYFAEDVANELGNDCGCGSQRNTNDEP